MTSFPTWNHDPYLADVRRQLQSTVKIPGFDALQQLSMLSISPLPAALIQIEAFTQFNESRQRFLADNQRQIDYLNRCLGQWTTQFAPGTVFGDLFLAREGDEGASWRLAERLMHRWKPSPEADKELRAQAKEEESTRARQKQSALQRAVIHVTQYMMKEVSVRVGRETIRNEDGSLWIVIPGDSPLDWYWWWVQHEAPTAADAELCGKPYPASRDRPSDAFGVIEYLPDEAGCAENAEAHRSSIDAFIDQMDAIGEIQDILEQATDGQRKLLDAMLSADTIAEAERMMGMKEGVGRQALFRLRNRVRRSA